MTHYQICSKSILYALVLITLSLFSPITSASDNAAEKHALHWGYTGAAGPAEWGNLSKKFALCLSGKRQSPVNILNEVTADLYPLRFQYQSVSLQVLNNGHTLQANYSSLGSEASVKIGSETYPVQTQGVYNSTLMLGDVPYKLLQFHFHTPSEHARDGQRYPMEVHLVHKSADGNLAVVGVFLRRGNENPTLAKVLNNVSSEINKVTQLKNIQINAADLLPDSRERFHYYGSLTTPPCSENVNWFVMKTPIQASSAQINQFENLIGKNARPLQPMHWRTMLISE
jgi:carbonic anhydrase